MTRFHFKLLVLGEPFMDTTKLLSFEGYATHTDALTIAMNRIQSCRLPPEETEIVLSFKTTNYEFKTQKIEEK